MGQENINQADLQRREANRQDDGKWGAWASGESGAELPPVTVNPPSLEEAEVESQQMDAEEIAEWASAGHRFDTGGDGVTARQAAGEITFDTEHGEFTAQRGDWVVMNGGGECFVVDDQTFQDGYSFDGEEGADPATLTGTVTDGVSVPIESPYANELLEVDLGDDAHPDDYDDRAQEIFGETGIDPNDPRFKMLNEAEGKSRDAHIRAVRQGRTRWLRRVQMLTAIGTGNRNRIFQAWRDMRRDTQIRKNLISEEQYWDSVADDMQRQAEMVATASLDEKAAPEVDPGALDGGMGPQPQPDPEHLHDDYAPSGDTAEMPAIAPDRPTIDDQVAPPAPPQPDTVQSPGRHPG